MSTGNRIIVRREAQRDIDRIGVYIGERNLEYGLRFFDAAREAFQILKSHPKIGSLRRGRDKSLIGVRSWPISGSENYLIFYIPSDDGQIDVLRVLHGAQDVDSMIDRR